MGARQVGAQAGNNNQLHQPPSDAVAIGPQAVIDALMQRVQQLTMENVMLQAALNQKERDGASDQGAMGREEASEQEVPTQ